MANIHKVSTAALRAADQNKLAIIETGTQYDKLGILFECPLDKAYTIDIYGKFFSKDISDIEEPETFWSVQYPFSLIHAGLYKYELGYRNTEGAADWLKAIQNDIRGIDFNVAEQTANEINQMQG